MICLKQTSPSETVGLHPCQDHFNGVGDPAADMQGILPTNVTATVNYQDVYYAITGL